MTGEKMYTEIIKHLMKWEVVGMIFWALLLWVLPSVVYACISRKKKKKKKTTKKKKWNNLTASPEEQALAFVIVGVLLFGIVLSIELFDYLSMREDMINENYFTYTGEFEYYSSLSGKRMGRRSRSYYVKWTDEHGETKTIKYNAHIEKFQANGLRPEKGYYQGTIVYSPSSDYLLWWDAEPIGD